MLQYTGFNVKSLVHVQGAFFSGSTCSSDITDNCYTFWVKCSARNSSMPQ